MEPFKPSNQLNILGQDPMEPLELELLSPMQLIQQGQEVIRQMEKMTNSFSNFFNNIVKGATKVTERRNESPSTIGILPLREIQSTSSVQIQANNVNIELPPVPCPASSSENFVNFVNCNNSFPQAVEVIGICNIAPPEVEAGTSRSGSAPTSSYVCDKENIGRPKRGRKRKFEMTREERKTKKNSYEDYENSKGKFSAGKEFRDYICNCHRECHTKIPIPERQKYYNQYKDSQNYNTQTALLGRHIREAPTEKKIEGSKRNYTRHYFFGEVEVCRPFFSQTLRVSPKRIDTALKKLREENMVDKRGSSGGHNKLSESKVDEVKDHINKIPKYRSHYCRNETESLFLPHEMTLQKMYDMYKEKYGNPVSFSAFRLIFHTNFNLRRKPLQKDTCSTCDSFECSKKAAQNKDDLDKITAEHNLHLALAADARALMKKDMGDAKEDDSLEVLTFDLEQTLPLPRLPSGILFYKRQLMLYNCGVHLGKTDTGHCYTWLEGDAGRGAQEVGSVLKKHLKDLPSSVTHLRLWSDSCGGQNRNIKIVLLLKSCFEENKNLSAITLNYLIPGHTYLPNDSDFGDIECALKHQQRLYTREDYESVMQKARKKNPLIIQAMSKEEFFGTSGIEKNITNRKKDVDKNKINWLETRSIQLLRDKPHSIFMSKKFSSDYVEVDIEKKSRGFKRPNFFYSPKLVQLWPVGKPISVEKLNDIKSYLHLIPPDCQEFYKHLTSSVDVIDDVDGFNGSLDFELEGFIDDESFDTQATE